MRKLIAIATIAIVATGIADTAKAQSDLGFKGVTFNLGTVSYAGGGLGLGARANFGELTDNLELDTRLIIWRSNQDAGFGNISLRDIAIQPGVTYRFPLENEKIMPFVSGGLAINFVSASASVDGFGTVYESDAFAGTYFGAQVGGGADYAINDRMALGAELILHTGTINYTEFAIRFTIGFGQ